MLYEVSEFPFLVFSVCFLSQSGEHRVVIHTRLYTCCLYLIFVLEFLYFACDMFSYKEVVFGVHIQT